MVRDTVGPAGARPVVAALQAARRTTAITAATDEMRGMPR
jgi:hypothetical protein